MPFMTAGQTGLDCLYHWQEYRSDRLEPILRNNAIYLSRPSDFNDPWDCRPFFNTDLLNDPVDMQKHIDWAVRICRQDGQMSETDIERMREALNDRDLLEEKIRQATIETQQAVLERYRVYCLCSNVQNSLMWAHYADSHRGVCLEFNVRNEVICGALEVQYSLGFPMTSQYSDEPAENLLPLLAKSKVWAYEEEWRLIAQNSDNRTPHGTLLAEDGFLKLPKGALTSIIVGCHGPVDEVRALTEDCGAEIPVLVARKIENRYAIEIEGI